ncbi:MAG: N-acetylmuramoyl-L-alanine amidase [Desulfuromonadales bacterium]|nr:N-acetylmuramoyl-L-alanine amidase [Desulfuromonadales bacterium]
MMVPKTFICLLLAIFLIGTPEADAAPDSYQQIRADYQSLVKSSQRQRQRTNWEKIIKRLDRFIRQHPDYENSENVYFLKAKTWHGLAYASGATADARKARDAYLLVADRYPASSLADDSLFRAADLSEELLSEFPAAYDAYRRVVEDYPSGDMFNQAKERLAGLPVPRDADLISRVHGENSRIDQLRFWSGPDKTRVVLDLNSKVKYKANLLKGKNPRLYIDLWQAESGKDVSPNISVNDGLLRQIRTSRYDKERMRVVLDLFQLQDYKVFALENPFRIVVDVIGKRLQMAKKAQPELRAPPQQSDQSIAGILERYPSVNQAPLHVPQQQGDEGIRLIVVDAGHGGKDPGAVGPNRTREKDVTLKMAKYLAEQLRKELKCEVRLTRSDDRYLKLRDRTSYANKVDADLFISLHANANKNRNAYGLETYFLNLAKNNQAAEVAARENGTTLEEVSHLEAILFDLMANAKINESSRLATEVQQALVSGLKPHYSDIKDLGVRQGPFHVLLGATMPSVLVETAFISNHREEKRLNSSDYQKRVASAIVRGVKSYAATLEQVAQK